MKGIFNMEERFKLSPPWAFFYKEIEALFGEDPDIKLQFDEDSLTIKMFVEGQDKADALDKLLPTQKEFGNVVVSIEIIPANRKETIIDTYRKAFEGNPVFSYAAGIEGIMTNPIYYIVFKNKVCQIWNDNLGDINGNTSTLYEDVARDIFDDTQNVCFNTDLPDNLGALARKL